jgi:hypothetical protein
MQEEGNILSSSQFQSAPVSIQVTMETVTSMLKQGKDIESQLTSVKMQHLMLIRNSPRYIVFLLNVFYSPGPKVLR